MSAPLVHIRYVDGAEVAGPPETWPAWRADGVDWITIGPRRLEGHSLYWLYREVDAWVAGCGSAYWKPTPPEVVFPDRGEPYERAWKSSWPDLRHAQVKLGWWRPR